MTYIPFEIPDLSMKKIDKIRGHKADVILTINKKTAIVPFERIQKVERVKYMSKIINELHISKYAILILDELPNHSYSKVLISGKEYDLVPVNDAKNTIAIESSNSFIGSEIEFI